MIRAWLAACACAVAACSRSGTGNIPPDEAGTPVVGVGEYPGPSRERIPAEWTIAEDTSSTGEVTTVSLQLPSARDIRGLVLDEAPRFILRCLDGRVQAFIDPGAPESEADTPVPDSQLVPVQLDSTPACE